MPQSHTSSTTPNLPQRLTFVNDVELASAELGPLGPPLVKLLRAVLAEQQPVNDAPRPKADMGTLCSTFGVSAPTVRKWIAAGCPFMQYGEVRRFEISAVEAWLSERSRGGAL